MKLKNVIYSMLLLMVFLAVSFVGKSEAKEYIYVGGWSYHFAEHPKDWLEDTESNGTVVHEYEFNSNHHMLGYQAKGLMVAHYDNSFGQSTWLVAKHFEKQHDTLPVSFIGQIGATNGYTDCDFEDKGTKAKTCPYYQVGMAITKFRVQPVISTSGSVWMLSLRARI